MFLLPPTQTLKTGMPLETRIPKLWDTSGLSFCCLNEEIDNWLKSGTIVFAYAYYEGRLERLKLPGMAYITSY